MLKKLSKFISKNKFFALIVVLAAALRIVAIDKTPPSLNWDEVSHGYNAYSILKTGKDEWGEFLPVIFRAYGDFKLPAYIYATVPSIAIFGLNSFAVRLPSVLAGIGTTIFTYFLAKELFTNKKHKSPITNHQSLATIASLLVAVEPWSFFLSRGAFEANLALFLFVAGVYFFLRGMRTTNYILLSTVLLGLTVWTYNSYRIFTPLMLVFLFIAYNKELSKVYYKNRRIFVLCSLFFVLCFVPMFYQFLNPAGQARYGEVAILDEGAINQINEQRNTSEFSPLISRLLYNKGTYFVQRFTSNYFSHFSPNFLFFEGGNHFQFSVPHHGLIYPLNSVFLSLGLLYLFKTRTKSSLLIVSWLLLAPIPSSLTREAPHVLRSMTMLPVPMMLSAFGLVLAFKWVVERLTNHKPLITNHLIFAIYLAFLFISAGLYLTNYFTDYRKNYSWSWQYGYEQVVDYIKSSYDEYDEIIMTKKYGESHEFILFYWPWDPEAYRSDPNLVRFYQSNWYWVDAFDKFYFVNDWQIDDRILGNYTFELESEELVHCTPRMFDCILVTSLGNAPEGWKKLETINFLNGEPAFDIYEN